MAISSRSTAASATNASTSTCSAHWFCHWLRRGWRSATGRRTTTTGGDTPCSASRRQLSRLQPAPTHERLSLTAAPISRASVGRGGCILRAPGGPVDLDRYPVRGGLRSDQFERPVPAGVREQPRALTDNHGEGEQGHLVDKVIIEQPPEQGAAAMHLQLASRLGFQLADGGRDLTGEDGRIRPPGVGECGRCHVLGLRVQRRPDWAVARIVPRSPGAGEDLVGPAAEQEGVGALVDLVHDRPGLVVEVGPSAAVEYAALVLLRPAGPLHHTVNGNLRGGRQLHRRGSFLVGLVVIWLMSKVAAVIAGLDRPRSDPRPG